MKTKKRTLKKGISIIVAFTLLLTCLTGLTSIGAAAASATLTVDMTDENHEIVHGAAGFLYGISNEDVPTTNTLVPLKPKILATKGALGTEHPYGDALDVAKTFLESGGEQVQMYNSNYYGVFGVTADYREYSTVLNEIIAPAVVAWKEAWIEEHGTPESPKDNIGRKIDIDKALVYIPINEGTPVVNAPGANRNEIFSNAWKSYYNAIKSADPNASVAGPNCWGYNGTVDYRYFSRFCFENDCIPEVYTWHELDRPDLRDMKAHMAEFRQIWEEEVKSKGGPDIPQIVINEYAEMIDCGVPGRLVNWIARLEDEGVYGCLPFWHQANNLNDLTADANEGNGAWWVYKWYGDMSGNTLSVSSNTSYDSLYGLATIDDAKQSSTVLLGGVDGSANVVLENVDKTTTFKDATKVHIKVQSTSFTGFHGAQTEVPTIIEGVYPVGDDGSVVIGLEDMKFATAYNVTVTKAGEDDTIGEPMVSKYQKVYEAENGKMENGALSVSHSSINPVYYFSGTRAVQMSEEGKLTYDIEVPVGGKYKLDFIYGNGTGSSRNDMYNHKPINIEQAYSLDGGASQITSMKSTLLSNMTGIHTQYLDLAAGSHSIEIETVGAGVVYHDMLTVTYHGAYEQPVRSFDTIYEAEQSDFNRLADNAASSVVTETTLAGYSGNGYVTGINSPMVTDGGGVRWNVIVEESGLYDISVRYQSAANADINVYVGNTATTLDKLTKTISAGAASDSWQTVNASIYLQKGINIVDIDATAEIALDYMRVKAISSDLKTGAAESVSIEAEDAIPNGSAIAVESSAGASNSQYVVGLEGDVNAKDDSNKYLELSYNAPAAGLYDIQVFQSNDEICGSHSYNTKIIDKYATFEVSNSGEVISADRHFFINTFSNDTFKEKTVQVYFKQGENKVKIYNDDSWQVLWGGTQSLPGENELDNFTPNFDKFVITPNTLSDAISLPEEYKVSISTTSGGYATADKNTVSAGGDVTVNLYPTKGVFRIEVNGTEMTDMIENNSLTIEDVQGDVAVKIVFAEGSGEYIDKYINNASFGNGSSEGWTTSGTAEVLKDADNSLEGYFLKAQGQLSQTVTGVPVGFYNLSVFTKNYGSDAITGTATISACGNSIELVKGSSYIENIIRVEVKEDGIVDIAVDTSDLSGYLCLDTFSLTPAKEVDPDLVDPDLEYFVDTGDHNPKTLSGNDKFGVKNSLTDQIYGTDKATGYKWGLVFTDADYVINPLNGGDGAYTLYQAANQNNVVDGLNKLQSFRYARNQTESGISPRYIRYMFELEPGEYIIETAFGNTWGNAGSPSLYVDDSLIGTASVAQGSNDTVTGSFTVDEDNREVLVEARSTNATIQMNYIKIEKKTQAASLGRLQAAYDNAKDIVDDPDDPYMTDRWEVFETARTAAKAILDEELVTKDRQAEVNAAEEALVNAQAALAKISDIIDSSIEYFVDAGDHWTSTLSGKDRFGVNNTVTDQLFGPDPVTGKQWGVVDYLDPIGERVQGTPGAPGAYTRYTWGNENSGESETWKDGSPKTSTFRYARGQDGSSEVRNTIGEMFVDYKFELEAGKEYEITVGLGNHWGNSSPVSVYANRGIGSDINENPGTVIKENVSASSGSKVTGNAFADEDGFLTVNVRKAIAGGATINVNYIIIRSAEPEEVDKTALQELYNANKDKSAEEYTKESFETFSNALAEAALVLEDAEATQQQVDDAAAKLRKAIDELVTAEKYLIGDVYTDGKISLKDVLAIQKHAAYIDSFEDDAVKMFVADADKDGTVKLSDALLIQKWIVKLIASDYIGTYQPLS